MTNQNTCVEEMSRKGGPWGVPLTLCRKPAKGVSPHGSPVCGQHLAMYKRRTHLAGVVRAEADASESNHRRAFRACELLKAVGIKATVAITLAALRLKADTQGW